MSPFSTPVLVGAALVSSPALWNVLQGTAPAEVALVPALVTGMEDPPEPPKDVEAVVLCV